MTCRLSPDENAAKAFSGTRATSESAREGVSAASAAAGGTSPMPAPGCSQTAMPSPTGMAAAVVTRYQPTVRPPMRPIRPRSPMELMPPTSETKMSGTTSILMAAMNA